MSPPENVNGEYPPMDFVATQDSETAGQALENSSGGNALPFCHSHLAEKG
jgi:hypothetical protein